VGADPCCQDYENVIADFRLNPEFVSLDVEYNPVIREETGAWIPGFYVCWSSPFGLFYFSDPCPEGLAYFRVLRSKFGK
jgi:hypothetical protein